MGSAKSPKCISAFRLLFGPHRRSRPEGHAAKKCRFGCLAPKPVFGQWLLLVLASVPSEVSADPCPRAWEPEGSHVVRKFYHPDTWTPQMQCYYVQRRRPYPSAAAIEIFHFLSKNGYLQHFFHMQPVHAKMESKWGRRIYRRYSIGWQTSQLFQLWDDYISE